MLNRQASLQCDYNIMGGGIEGPGTLILSLIMFFENKMIIDRAIKQKYAMKLFKSYCLLMMSSSHFNHCKEYSHTFMSCLSLRSEAYIFQSFSSLGRVSFQFFESHGYQIIFKCCHDRSAKLDSVVVFGNDCTILADSTSMPIGCESLLSSVAAAGGFDSFTQRCDLFT